MSAATARKVDAPRPIRRESTPTRPELRVLPAPRFQAPRGPFALVVGAVLTVGLLGVLLLNTVVTQDAFAVSALQQKSAALADEEQSLTQQVAAAESPQRLERRARGLGMVPSVNPVFLRLADGKVLGDPVAGKAPRRAAAPAAAKPATGTPSGGVAVPQATGAPVPGAKPGSGTPTVAKTKAAAALKTKAAKARR